jgi:thioredoxin-like negative regulator of GroEL
MIELLLAAERMLSSGDLDHAERLFSQVAEADPQNAIAVVGLARVASARGEPGVAKDLATRALAIDPEDEAARRLLAILAVPKPAAPVKARPPRSSILVRLRALLRLGG